MKRDFFTLIILILLALVGLYFLFVLAIDAMKKKDEISFKGKKAMITAGSGFVANFFDALGIGSFATLIALIKSFKLTNDIVLPGTLNVACTIPTIFEAFIFIKSVNVAPITLILMIIAAIVGATIGAGVVSKFNEKRIQIIMGITLFIVAIIMLLSQLKFLPVGGTALGLVGYQLVIAVVVNFILGDLMMVGIGLYAPCMALVFALGLSPRVAFPIMMGSCAFLMPVASIKFIKEDAYDVKATVIISIIGSLGVLIAGLLVKSLPLYILTWLVIIVVFYTSFSMFKSFMTVKKS